VSELPALLVIDTDLLGLERIEAQLTGRYGRDYHVARGSSRY
jgi:hypothetical protein